MPIAGEHSVVKTTVNNNTVTIKVSGGFDYYILPSFRDAYKQHPGSMKFTVDLRKASYADSAAIGILLILLEHVGNDKEKLHVVGCNQKIKKALDMARLGDIMTIP